jgi:hypothetical protein
VAPRGERRFSIRLCDQSVSRQRRRADMDGYLYALVDSDPQNPGQSPATSHYSRLAVDAVIKLLGTAFTLTHRPYRSADWSARQVQVRNGHRLSCLARQGGALGLTQRHCGLFPLSPLVSASSLACARQCGHVQKGTMVQHSAHALAHRRRRELPHILLAQAVRALPRPLRSEDDAQRYVRGYFKVYSPLLVPNH